MIKRSFRKYHRWLALIVSLPLILIVLSGILVTIAEEWPIDLGLPRGLLLRLHTGKIFHLEAIYPIFSGLGLVGLLVTGISMLNLFKRKPSAKAD
ncbi:MAG: peptidase [Microcoleaceae cyanobacterium]